MNYLRILPTWQILFLFLFASFGIHKLFLFPFYWSWVRESIPLFLFAEKITIRWSLPWILKQAGLEISGQRRISSIGTTKRITFLFSISFLVSRFKKKVFFSSSFFLRFLDFSKLLDIFHFFLVFFMYIFFFIVLGFSRIFGFFWIFKNFGYLEFFWIFLDFFFYFLYFF